MRKAPSVPLSFCCAEAADSLEDAWSQAIKVACKHSWSAEVAGVSASGVVTLAGLEILCVWHIVGRVVVRVRGREERWYYFFKSRDRSESRAQVEALRDELKEDAASNPAHMVWALARAAMLEEVLKSAS